MYNAINEDLMFLEIKQRADAMRNARSAGTQKRRFWHRTAAASVPGQVARRAR